MSNCKSCTDCLAWVKHDSTELSTGLDLDLKKLFSKFIESKVGNILVTKIGQDFQDEVYCTQLKNERDCLDSELELINRKHSTKFKIMELNDSGTLVNLMVRRNCKQNAS